MCGFIFVKQTSSSRITKASFERALERQAWRGPDPSRIISLDNGSTFIGHTRLAIIDPMPRSDQPMASKDGRYLIAFNGEIYNHADLRERLEHDCVTNSDTETIHICLQNSDRCDCFGWCDRNPSQGMNFSLAS